MLVGEWGLKWLWTGVTAVALVLGQDPEPTLLGAWDDDYGSSYTVSATRFTHGSHSVYEIVRWNRAERYFIAQNAAGNRSDGGKWTRVDWMPFTGMAPYTWGFCLTAYRAESRADAEATPPANRETPRSGCNGFPFTRMKPRS